MSRHAVYPGSFDPLTRAHLAVADAAVATGVIDEVRLVLSDVALAKESGHHDDIGTRLAAIAARADAAPARPWLRAERTPHQFVSDIARGAAAVVVGADKWEQLVDVSFYADAAARDASLRALPHVLVAPRGTAVIPDDEAIARWGLTVTVLDVPSEFAAVSSTAVRAGRAEWRA